MWISREIHMKQILREIHMKQISREIHTKQISCEIHVKMSREIQVKFTRGEFACDIG